MAVYADTSVLISLYTSDTNTTEAALLLSQPEDLVLVTPFGESEFVNSVELRVFRKDISAIQADRSLRDFQKDLDAGTFLFGRPVPAGSYERAILLSRRHTRQTGTRGMDVLHIAIALELSADVFYTFDKGQAKLAKRAGLSVRPGR